MICQAFDESYDGDGGDRSKPRSFADLTKVADIIGEDIVPTGKLVGFIFVTGVLIALIFLTELVLPVLIF